MLLEIILYASARTTPELARLGLKGDAVALWSRATRCRSAWAPHEARCHAAVRAATADLPRRHTALVLGSGLLRDVALAHLVESFQRVILVDAVHLVPAHWRARHPKVELVTADLSGVAAWLAGEAGGRMDPLAAFRDDPVDDKQRDADHENTDGVYNNGVSPRINVNVDVDPCHDPLHVGKAAVSREN